ncbi:MAG TPA: pilus assembly protein TadG-related protein [Gaiellaceae bacterium]|nr:pilus assembly protein TadG-related protein [Gaiellaceae bacterium]
MNLRIKNQRGQAMVLTLVFMIVLLGMAAAVLDVGAWYRAHRGTQATADASALAGAQDLPDFPSSARTAALDYAGRNGGGVQSQDVEFESGVVANDTIKVTARKSAAGVFTRLFGIDSVTARSTAKARAGAMGDAKWAAPIGIDYRHQYLRCNAQLQCNPRFDEATEIDFTKVGPGAFRLINIDGSYGGTSSDDIGEWISHGLDAYMPRNKWYYSDPGMKPNSSHVTRALDERIGVGKEILLPIYTQTRAQGAGFEYYVVGWVGFRVSGYEINGAQNARIQGQFTRVIWDGIQSEDGNEEDFGARSVHLVE